jgi:hypothetical protein
MWGHVPKTHPPSNPHGLKQIGLVVPSYVKAWSIGQKSPPGPCVGWVDLYSHSNWGWLDQSMLLFPFPCLGRSLGNNSLTFGQDVRPCVWKVSSSRKSTSICRSSYLNWTSLDVAKMLFNYDIGSPCLFAINIDVPILIWFLLVLIGAIPFWRNGMIMLLVDLQAHFHAPSF